MRIVALILAALLLATAARSDGIYNPPANGVGLGDGIFNFGSAAVVGPCDQTGLDFTLDCNMILIPALIH